MDSSAISKTQFPNYENPPVIEVVFGIQFKTLNQLTTPHIGLFWEKLDKKTYPNFREMPELPHVVEEENPSSGSSQPIIEQYFVPPLPRLFFITTDQSHLIQLQRDKFINNWRKISSGTEYPRFKTLFPQFQDTLNRFSRFVKEINAGDIIPDQYELTYVNHISRESGWQALRNIETVFPDFLCKETSFLPEPEHVSWRKIYRLPDKQGRLYVSAHDIPGKYVLNLTARGFGTNINSWFEIAHEWIVKGFADLTGKEIQKNMWKQTS
jgi:uncharacterized protein (TIGR04255 family)